MFDDIFNKIKGTLGSDLPEFNIPQERLEDVINLGRTSVEDGIAKEVQFGNVDELVGVFREPPMDITEASLYQRCHENMLTKLELAGLDSNSAERATRRVIGDALSEIIDRASKSGIEDDVELRNWITQESNTPHLATIEDWAEDALEYSQLDEYGSRIAQALGGEEEE